MTTENLEVKVAEARNKNGHDYLECRSNQSQDRRTF